MSVCKGWKLRGGNRGVSGFGGFEFGGVQDVRGLEVSAVRISGGGEKGEGDGLLCAPVRRSKARPPAPKPQTLKPQIPQFGIPKP